MKIPFKKGPTTRSDLVFAVATALMGVWKAVDTAKQYKADQAILNQAKELEK